MNDILPLKGDVLSTPVALNDCGQVLASSEGAANGELAFLYLTGCVVLLFAGAGKYSVDKK